MSGHGYLTGTQHAATLSTAMDDFQDALTYRWRQVVTEKIMQTQHDYPVRIRRDGSPRSEQPIWEYWSAAAVHHLKGGGGHCSYVAWVEGGQNGDLGSVTCPGVTGADEEVQVIGPTGQPETVPPTIRCGMGDVLGMVENWAWGEREHVYHGLPLFDMHDLGVLKAAHDEYLGMGARLGMEPGAGSADTGVVFTPVSERELAGKVQDLSGQRAQGQDWWAGWTGLAASRAKAGFFASVAPTMNNQSGIVGSLANLYASRAAIIEKGRNDALYWIQWATKSLKETQPITTNLVPGWKIVQGVGTAISIYGGWSPIGAAVGAGLTLVGFIGENLIPSAKSEGYKSGMEEVVEQLNTKVDELNSALDDLELGYANDVATLKDAIFDVHSYNLELYDLTRNNPHGDDPAPKEGYTADIERILAIGQACYDAADLYDELLPMIAHTSTADAHLADKDGRPTEGDKSLLGIRDQLEEFLKTATSRYVLAGDQVKASAEEYVKVDTAQKAAYDRIMTDWQEANVGDNDIDFDPGEEADATDRTGSGTSGGHPTTGGDRPGAGDGQDYETQN